MKVLASDFDGTLFRNDTVCDENIEAIKEWREKGNVFGIITGRDLRMTMKPVKEYNIPYDFLICNNGSVIYDKELKVLTSTRISSEILNDLFNHPYIQESLHLIFSTEEKTYLYAGKKESWILKSNFPMDLIEKEELMNIIHLNQVSTAFLSCKKASSCAEKINETMGNYLLAHQNINCVDITPKGVSKCTSLKNLLQIKKWEDEKIYVIGDSYNDLPMIEYFHGYTMNEAEDEIKVCATKAYDSVAQLIKENI